MLQCWKTCQSDLFSLCASTEKDDETCCIAIWHVTKLQAKKKVASWCGAQNIDPDEWEDAKKRPPECHDADTVTQHVACWTEQMKTKGPAKGKGKDQRR